MPLGPCKVKGKSGTRWGHKGKCYAGPKGKAKALRQMRAIRASGYTGNANCGTGAGGFKPGNTCASGEEVATLRATERVRLSSEREAQELANSVCEVLGIDPPVVRYADDIYASVLLLRGSTGHYIRKYKHYPATVELHKEASRVSTLLHELAHHLSPGPRWGKTEHGDKFKRNFSKVIEAYIKSNLTGNSSDINLNAWCPTGEGGGRDNSCSRYSHVTSTNEFRTWFKGSEIVDSSGDPIPVYHGTSSAFDEFSPERIGARDGLGYYGAGYYFTPSPVSAEMYSSMWSSNPTGANIKPVFLNIKNPYNYKKIGHWGKYGELSGVALTRALQQDGYDGVIAGHGSIVEIVAFDKNQIRSAITGNASDTQNVYCPTGEGGGVDPSCLAADKGGNFSGGMPTEKQRRVIQIVRTLQDKRRAEPIPKELLEINPLATRSDWVNGDHIIRTFRISPRDLDSLVKKGWLEERASGGFGPEYRIAQIENSNTSFFYSWEIPVGNVESCCGFTTNIKRRIQNPLRIDPSRTATLRRAFTADLLRRFEVLRKELRQLIVIQDAFGLAPTKPFTFNAKQYAYLTLPEKSKAFLRTVMHITERQLLDATQDELHKWWSKYSLRAYREGAGDAFDFIKKRRWGPKEGDFYRGSKQQFLQSALNRPADLESVKLMSDRIYSDLKGISDAVSAKLNRTLTDGMVQGKSPAQIAEEISDDIESIGKNRAKILARTEMVRAKAEGQLAALESLNVPGVTLKVEWVPSGLGTTRKGNMSPCPKCRAMANKVYTLQEAKGLIPHHPNCMCGWTPASLEEQEA